MSESPVRKGLRRLVVCSLVCIGLNSIGWAVAASAFQGEEIAVYIIGFAVGVIYMAIPIYGNVGKGRG